MALNAGKFFGPSRGNPRNETKLIKPTNEEHFGLLHPCYFILLNCVLKMKTPVSLLQELMMKEGYIPQYVDATYESPTSTKMFSVTVHCKDRKASGNALNKKDAKQKAATEMLKILNKWPEPENSISKFNLPKEYAKECSTVVIPEKRTESFSNFVGKLNEFCAIRKLPYPVYTDVARHGPCHMPSFTIRCSASSLSEEATANSRKQAKQDAAQKLYNHLEPLTNDDLNTPTLDKIIEKLDLSRDLTMELSKINENIGKAKFYYIEKSKGKVLNKKNIDVSDYHLQLKRTYSEIADISKQKIKEMLINKDLQVNSDKIRALLQYICNTFDCKMQQIIFPTASKNRFAIGCRLTVFPTIFTIGLGSTKEIANQNAMLHMLKAVLDLLK